MSLNKDMRDPEEFFLPKRYVYVTQFLKSLPNRDSSLLQNISV